MVRVVLCIPAISVSLTQLGVYPASKGPTKNLLLKSKVKLGPAEVP